MKYLVILGFALVAAASEVPNAFDYHTRVGIPEAKRLKEVEENALLNSRNTERIVGGVVSPINAHPHLVSVVFHFDFNV